MLLFRISVQLSVESLIAHAVCNCQHAWSTASTLDQLPARLSNYQRTFTLLQGVSNLILSIGQFTLSVRYAIKRG